MHIHRHGRSDADGTFHPEGMGIDGASTAIDDGQLHYRSIRASPQNRSMRMQKTASSSTSSLSSSLSGPGSLRTLRREFSASTSSLENVLNKALRASEKHLRDKSKDELSRVRFEHAQMYSKINKLPRTKRGMYSIILNLREQLQKKARSEITLSKEVERLTACLEHMEEEKASLERVMRDYRLKAATQAGRNWRITTDSRKALDEQKQKALQVKLDYDHRIEMQKSQHNAVLEEAHAQFRKEAAMLRLRATAAVASAAGANTAKRAVLQQQKVEVLGTLASPSASHGKPRLADGGEPSSVDPQHTFEVALEAAQQAQDRQLSVMQSLFEEAEAKSLQLHAKRIEELQAEFSQRNDEWKQKFETLESENASLKAKERQAIVALEKLQQEHANSLNALAKANQTCDRLIAERDEALKERREQEILALQALTLEDDADGVEGESIQSSNQRTHWTLSELSR